MSNSVMLKSYNGAIKLILDPDMNFNELLQLFKILGIEEEKEEK